MMKKFGIRALVAAGLLLVGASAGFAQANMKSTVRRVAPSQEKNQPIAMSSVIMASKISLSADQRAKVVAMNNEVASLQAERTRLWAEYRAVKARPDFSDDMAAIECAPRMARILVINNTLAPIVARQDAQLATILTASQHADAARLMVTAKSAL